MSIKRKSKTTGDIIADIIFWILLAVIVFCIFFFKFKFIETGSMKPELQVGAVVVINPHQKANFDDIAMYQKNNYFVIHRLIGKDENGYIFKGDNVATPDFEPVSEDQIVGPVVAKFNFVAPVFRALHGLEP